MSKWHPFLIANMLSNRSLCRRLAALERAGRGGVLIGWFDERGTSFGCGDGQRRHAALPFDEVERTTWAYTPGPRRGAPMWALDRRQTKTAFQLLAALLAPPAFARAVAVMGLEEVLDE